MKFKYVMFDHCYPVIFSLAIPHNEVRYKDLKPTSAGFVRFIYDDERDCVDVVCFGESVGLRLKSRFEDADIIRTLCEVD